MRKVGAFFVLLFLIVGGYFVYEKGGKYLTYYPQLSKERVSMLKDLQPKSQKDAVYVGAVKCKECHEDEYKKWAGSRHPKMIQDIKKSPKAIVADFSKLPKDADFNLSEIVYTIGGKFKQRYMIRKDFNNSEDYRVGNYQWNVQTKKWQPFHSWHYWYDDAFFHDNRKVPTSRVCDGCHFTGFMASQKRIEPGIGCESCHGPASKHIKEPKKYPVFVASKVDSNRQNEVCLQCHMRNRDIRLKNHTMRELFMDIRDYPLGYQPGKPLVKYKMPAPFIMGRETIEFYANGLPKKNRTQGNEFVHSIKGHHGITCINCHDPHSLHPVAEHNNGNELCMKCHSFGSPIGPHQKSLSAHTHHKPDSNGSLCVECHMPKVGKHTKRSPFTVRSHSFGFVTPKETIGYGLPPETNACYACHKDKSLQKLQKDLEEWGVLGWGEQMTLQNEIKK
jgi:hypothetical protein